MPLTVSIADLFYVVGYPCVAGGVLLLVRARQVKGHREGILDGMAFGVAAAIVAWQAFAAPAVTADGSVFELATAALYPLADALLLACVAWLVLAPGRRGGAGRILVGGLGLMLFTDIAYATASQTGDGHLLDFINPLSCSPMPRSPQSRGIRTLRR